MSKSRLDDTQTDDIVGAGIPGALKMTLSNHTKNRSVPQHQFRCRVFAETPSGIFSQY